MKYLKKTSILLSLLIILSSCGEDYIDYSETVAKVGSSRLSRNELDRMKASANYAGKHENEIIRNWVEDRLVFSEAVEKGIKDTKEYNELIRNIEVKAAIAVYLDKKFSNIQIENNSTELENYYSLNKKEFVSQDDAYAVNLASFSDKGDAGNFRLSVFRSGWNESTDLHGSGKFSNDTLLYDHSINDVKLNRVILGLLKGEISIVIETEPGVFNVVQLIERYGKGSVPPFKYIRDYVDFALTALKRQEMFRNHIDNLYNKYEVKIYGSD